MVRERGERPEERTPPQMIPPRPQFAPPVDWWKLDTRERAEILSEVLGPWVLQLVHHYGLPAQVVVPCWYRHDALIQELLALFQYRNQQQFLTQAPPSAPLDFHVQLQLSIARLRGWVQQLGCNESEHSETRIPAWATSSSQTTSFAQAQMQDYLARRLEDSTGSSSRDSGGRPPIGHEGEEAR